jgi:uracil-DNA glycosylase family 4
MKHGFFSASEMRTETRRLANTNHCGACGAARRCKHPKMPYRGKGRRKILVVGEAPGSNEDRKNEQFVGKAGKRLMRELSNFGIELNRDCWKTNAVRCYPSDGETPNSKRIAYCRPALFQEIRRLKPEKILLFGNVAAESVLGQLWGASGKYPLTTWGGWNIPHQELDAWLSVHYHPSFLERSSDPLLDLIFRRGLKKALAKRDRPWNGKPPNYAEEVELIYQPSQVVKALRDFRRVLAFDYETNCIKPEYPGAEIVSCAVCGGTAKGERTYAFPWVGEAIAAVGTLLRGSSQKVASNAKFEERWTRHVFGHGVRRWFWDTMLAAHVLNNAKGITGLKFQAFVLLGLPRYDTHIEPYIKTVGHAHINRIRELSWEEILLYNGLDSKTEYKIARMQRKQMRV